MGGGWRVCVAFGILPFSRRSFRQALIPVVDSRLGDEVTVGSTATRVYVYVPGSELADEAAQVAREVLAQRGIDAPVWMEVWSHRDQSWRYANDTSVDPEAEWVEEERSEEEQHADRQEAERERSVATGVPAWQVRIEVPSHRDVIALAAYLTAQGWRVRRRPRSLIVSADCEDDAKGLGRALAVNGHAGFRVGRVSYRYMYNMISTA